MNLIFLGFLLLVYYTLPWYSLVPVVLVVVLIVVAVTSVPSVNSLAAVLNSLSFLHAVIAVFACKDSTQLSQFSRAKICAK